MWINHKWLCRTIITICMCLKGYMMTKITTIATHNGKFHNDEVCAIALLHLGDIGEYKIVRTRDADAIADADYVVDVGGIHDPENCRFDHHQWSKEQDGRSSAGLVYSWLIEEYDECYAPVMEYNQHVASFVSEVDYRDLNGPTSSQKHHEFFELINELNKDDIYCHLQDEAFLFAVDSYVRYIRTGFKIPKQLIEVAANNKAAKAANLARKVDELECWNGGKIHVYSTKNKEYVPVENLPEDWDIFVSWDAGQKAYTVLCNSEKGIVLSQEQDKLCKFVHKAGFIGKFQAHGKLTTILNDGTKLSIPVMRTVQEALRMIETARIVNVKIVEEHHGQGVYMLSSAGTKGAFTEAPTGNAKSYWNILDSNDHYIECIDGRIIIHEDTWVECAEHSTDFFSMVLTETGDWCYYTTFKEAEEEYRFDTLENEEVENNLLSA